VERNAPDDGHARGSAGGRLGRSDYLAIGMRILAEEGPAGLTTTNVCDRLQITRGSFYHHFPSLRAFNEALIAHWETDHLEQSKAALAGVDMKDRPVAIKNIGVAAPHRAERAIRIWAYTDVMVAAAQHRVDARRIAETAAVLREAGLPPDEAENLAHIGITIMVGTQVMDGLDRRRRTKIVNTFARWVDEVLAQAATNPTPGPGVIRSSRPVPESSS
jgi:AcrR family transcriptional regulator